MFIQLKIHVIKKVENVAWVIFHFVTALSRPRDQWRTLRGKKRGAIVLGGNSKIFWKTIVFCSKTIEISDVIFSKQ